MAAPDTVWQIVVSCGWWATGTTPTTADPLSRFVSKYYLQSSVGGATDLLASELAFDITIDYLLNRTHPWWASRAYFESCLARHLATGTEVLATFSFSLGEFAAAGSLEMPWNAAAMVFGRAKDVGHQTRQWFGGLNSELLSPAGQVDWTSDATFRNFVVLSFAPRVVSGRTYSRVVYDQKNESVHALDELVRVGQWRAIRRRSLTGAESYSPL